MFRIRILFVFIIMVFLCNIPQHTIWPYSLRQRPLIEREEMSNSQNKIMLSIGEVPPQNIIEDVNRKIRILLNRCSTNVQNLPLSEEEKQEALSSLSKIRGDIQNIDSILYLMDIQRILVDLDKILQEYAKVSNLASISDSSEIQSDYSGIPQGISHLKNFISRIKDKGDYGIPQRISNLENFISRIKDKGDYGLKIIIYIDRMPVAIEEALIKGGSFRSMRNRILSIQKNIKRWFEWMRSLSPQHLEKIKKIFPYIVIKQGEIVTQISNPSDSIPCEIDFSKSKLPSSLELLLTMGDIINKAGNLESEREYAEAGYLGGLYIQAVISDLNEIFGYLNQIEFYLNVLERKNDPRIDDDTRSELSNATNRIRRKMLNRWYRVSRLSKHGDLRDKNRALFDSFDSVEAWMKKVLKRLSNIPLEIEHPRSHTALDSSI